MFDINLIREDSKKVQEGLLAKRVNIDLQEIVDLDKQHRELLTELEKLRNQKNLANDEITAIIKQKANPKDKIASMKEIALKIDQLEPKVKEIAVNINAKLLTLPNLAHQSVPVGSPENNKEVRRCGALREFDFPIKPHFVIAQELDIIDFKRGTKISASNFILYKGAGAKLERALINFMLDIHTKEHHYKEIFPPFLVNADSMTGTGQLPKMAEDMYKLKDDELYLIPTAEVPVTNIHRDEVFNEEDLPVYYTAYSACFRREAGSYGKDTRGLIRVHQFNKVELVKFVKPENSYDELEKLVNNAEKILQLLKLPYRVIMLASGDLSFAAAKCYDLEAYAPGLDKWLEVSSCSNFEDFQARRANIKFKSKELKKTAFVHTLNGSGLALPRVVVAILENYQTKDGRVIIPEVLKPYFDGQEVI